MTKYKEYFKRMCEENKEAFDEFKALHDKYAEDKKGLQPEFNEVGEPMVKIIREWENKLCLNMEKGKNNPFSNSLSEKFWLEVKTVYPLIDFVGIIRG